MVSSLPPRSFPKPMAITPVRGARSGKPLCDLACADQILGSEGQFSSYLPGPENRGGLGGGGRQKGVKKRMDDGNLSNPAGGWREKGGGGFWGWNEGVGCVGVAESQPVPAGLRRGGEGIWGGGTRPGVVDSTRQVYVSCRQCTLQHCASSRVPPQSWLYPSLAQPCRKPCWALRFAVELTVPDRYPREPSFPRCNPCYRRLLDEWLASEALVGQAPEGSNDCHPDSSMDSAGYPSSGIALLSALPPRALVGVTSRSS